MLLFQRVLLVLTIALPFSTGCGGPERDVTNDLPAGTGTEADQNLEVVEEFWPGGEIRLRKTIIRNPDDTVIDHGDFTRWHDNGRIEYEAVFDWGKKQGPVVRYHKNGEIWTEEQYLDGLKHGSCRTWNDRGLLVKEEQFAAGTPHGIWTVWKDERIKSRRCYENGIPVPCHAPAADEAGNGTLARE